MGSYREMALHITSKCTGELSASCDPQRYRSKTLDNKCSLYYYSATDTISLKEKTMTTIEIDFDVFKELTNRRATESISYNDVLRQVLGLNPLKPSALSPLKVPSEGAWATKGVIFPIGTDFRANYKGQTIFGKVESGSLVVNGKRFDSPSSAATSITGNMVNGWIFWECRLPGKTSWQKIKTLRK